MPLVVVALSIVVSAVLVAAGCGRTSPDACPVREGLDCATLQAGSPAGQAGRSLSTPNTG